MAPSARIQAPEGKGRSADEEVGFAGWGWRVRKYLCVCACVYGGVSLQVCVGRIKERASVSVGSWYSGREDV